jgi:NADH-quinone oxidoreductase subunit N
MMPQLDILSTTPMIFVAAGAVFLPLIEVLLARMIRNRRIWLGRPMNRELAGTAMVFTSFIVLALALISTLSSFSLPTTSFNLDHPMILIDDMTRFLHATLLIGGILTVLASSKYLVDADINHGEYYALVLASLLGMMLLAASTDLIMLFLSVELMSIPIYVLAGFQRRSLRSNESALKYFITGSFASGILLYGCSLLYGATGSVLLPEIAAGFDPESPLALLGAALVLIGLAFKVSSVPFHQWAPDVYEGAPTVVSGFMATTVKVAAFGALIRVLAIGLSPGPDLIADVLWMLAFLSMTVGNIMALIQQDAKRMLAYSSVAHAGYVLVGVCVGTEAAYAAVFFYLLVYTFMTIAAFAVIAMLARDGQEPTRIDDLAGLQATQPLLAFVMAVAMFALAGIPGTGGFMGKFQIFSAAIAQASAVGDTSLVWLAVAGVLNSAISLGYYLRLPVVMYMRDAESDSTASLVPGALQRGVLIICVLAIFLLGVVPQDVFMSFGQVDLLGDALAAAASLTP